MIQDSEAYKMDLVGGFERTLGDKVKPSAYFDYRFSWSKAANLFLVSDYTVSSLILLRHTLTCNAPDVLFGICTRSKIYPKPGKMR